MDQLSDSLVFPGLTTQPPYDDFFVYGNVSTNFHYLDSPLSGFNDTHINTTSDDAIYGFGDSGTGPLPSERLETSHVDDLRSKESSGPSQITSSTTYTG